MSTWRWLRTRASGAEGFTLIETVVALAVLSIGILGMAIALDTGRKLSLVSERHATMAHIAQKEIERLEGIAYSDLGMNATPGPHATDPANPDYYLLDGNPPSFEWDRTAGTSETINVDSKNGEVTPVQNWSEGQLAGQIYDFITWSTDPKCAPGCPSSQDYKRITVSVTMSGGLQPNPIYVSSVVADPQAMPAGGISNGNSGNPLNNPNTYCTNSSGNTVLCTSPIDNGSPNTWFLHDCPATSSSCQPPSGDHPLHDTVGLVTGSVCTTSQTLATIASNVTGCPVPDLMDSNPPPSGSGGTTTCPTTGNPLCDYSSDVPGCSGSCTPTPPGGLTLPPTCTGSSGCGTGSTSDCSNGAFSTTLLNAQSHMWVTSPLTSSMTLNGEGGLSMFTSTFGGANAVVSFCIEIYDVPPSGSAGSVADLFAWPPTDLGGSGYVADTDPSTGGNWPTVASQVNYIFNFRGSNGAVTVPSGHRVGVRIWMKANTNAAIGVMYDNPLFPAQLQLNSQ